MIQRKVVALAALGFVAGTIPPYVTAQVPSSPTDLRIDQPLPPCDYTIRAAADWSHVNDGDKRVICVAPAPTYTNAAVGVVKLTASGTSASPRWLRWDRNDDVHPATVSASETAAVSQFDVSGSYWIIDRIVVRDSLYQPGVSGRGNVLQRMVFESPRDRTDRTTGVMLVIWGGSDHTIVDNVFRKPLRKKGMDSYAIYNSAGSRVTIKGNEIIDLPDGLQSGPNAGGGNYFVDNEIYHTPAIYTDCNGNFTPSGACSCSEGMGVVPKGPSSQSMSYIERNLVWGFKRSDSNCAGSGAGGSGMDFGSGAAMTRNFTIRKNVILGAGVVYGLYFGRYIEDIVISGNYVSGADKGIENLYGQRITVTDNVYYNNRIIDYSTSSMAQGNTLSGNRKAGSGELCVVTRHLTNPQQRCVPY